MPRVLSLSAHFRHVQPAHLSQWFPGPSLLVALDCPASLRSWRAGSNFLYVIKGALRAPGARRSPGACDLRPFRGRRRAPAERRRGMDGDKQVAVERGGRRGARAATAGWLAASSYSNIRTLSSRETPAPIHPRPTRTASGPPRFRPWRSAAPPQDQQGLLAAASVGCDKVASPLGDSSESS
jgi:hypothetical protein